MLVYHGNNGFLSVMKRVHGTHPERVGSLNYLLSYAYEVKLEGLRAGGFLGPLIPNLFIDSGAFTAWKGGTAIDIDSYLKFLEEYKEVITVAAALDVIGDPVASWQNWIYMKEKGCLTLPAYHIGEPLKWLHQYVDAGATYIGLGGIAGEDRKVRHRFLDQVFQHYPDESKIGFHGFGVTDEGIMAEYPWRSVDSTAAMNHSIRGTTYTPWGITRPEAYTEKQAAWVVEQGRDPRAAVEPGYMGCHERFMINVRYFEAVGARPKVKSASRNFLF